MSAGPDQAGPCRGAATERLLPDRAGIERAAAILRAGGLVAFPTETVYGLGADATAPEAIARLYGAKERPRFNPLIAHVASPGAAFEQGVFGPKARGLANAFWPGPLTLVVPLAPESRISELARAGLDSVGLRVPAHPIARALLELTDRPIAAPSANRSGKVSPTHAAHVLADLDGRVDAVLEGGPAQVGLESTIVACLEGEPRLLRPGGVPTDAIEAVLGAPLLGSEKSANAPLAPGMLASHYAPRARVRLNVQGVEPAEAVLLFGRPGMPIQEANAVLNLSESGNLAEAAANLFSHLRALDASGARTIAVAPIPLTGLGEAINDRLARAAAKRPAGAG